MAPSIPNPEPQHLIAADAVRALRALHDALPLERADLRHLLDDQDDRYAALAMGVTA